MKVLGSTPEDVKIETTRKRFHRYEWCRLRNDFIDDPLWRVAAVIAEVPLYQVQAFVVRLDSLANKSDPRGYVGDFSAAEFAAAHGMPPAEAARIYAALEHPDVRWIEQDYVATFYGRNPDKEDVTAPDRDRRRKARKWIRTELHRRCGQGFISEEERDAAEAMVAILTDVELHATKKKLAGGAALEAALSTGHIGHGVAYRGFRGATPRADQSRAEISSPAVDNSGAATRGAAQGFPEEQGAPDDAQSTEAELWLASEAVRIIVERMDVPRPRAETLIARWRRDLDDNAVAMATIIRGCDDSPLLTTAARFHVAVTEHVQRCVRAWLKGDPLPLPPVRNHGTDPLISTGPRHGVAAPAVDKPHDAGESPPGRTGTEG